MIKILFTILLFSCNIAEIQKTKQLTPREIFVANNKRIPVVHSYYDKTYSGNGSSFVVSYKNINYLITNYHVITAGRFVVEYAGKFHDAEVLRVNDFEDIAVLTFPGIEKINAIPIQNYEPGEGELAYAIGYPYIEGNASKPNLTISEGLVSNSKLLINRGENGTKRYIQLSVPVNPGNSGGPVFNDFGKLIGMTTLKWLNLSSVSAAIPTADIIREINSIPKTNTITEADAIRSLKKRLDLIAISVNEMDLLEFGFHYSPSVKLFIYPYAKKSAENVFAVIQDATNKYPNDNKAAYEHMSKNLSNLDSMFLVMLFDYLEKHPKENARTVVESPFKVTEVYLAARFFAIFMNLANLPYKEIDFTHYKVNKINFDKDKTHAVVDATIFLSKKSFPIQLEFVREWGIWFLVPSFKTE